MSLFAVFLLVIGLGTIGWVTARLKAMAFTSAGSSTAVRPHSRPNYHGWHVAIWAAGPALLLLAIWSFVQPSLVQNEVLAAIPVSERPASDLETQMLWSEIKSLATGETTTAFDHRAEQSAELYKTLNARWSLLASAVALIVAMGGGIWAFSRIRPDFRARNNVERFVMGALICASLIAIITTFGIVASLLFESIRFFREVSPVEFLFGLNWSPQMAIREDQAGSSGAFGAVPLFWGTIFIGAIIAMIVAIPLGLMSAIYLTQYARPVVRSILKPVLEVLAGVPTVVYGYFAALTVAPWIRDVAVSIGISSASSESALAAGVVMGVMIIPFVSSMADDSINAVPQAMRDGSLAMGATTSETIRRVLIPAALPGIVGGVLLAVSRAIGETMIVVMAAGLAARLTANPFQSVTTVTTQIVQLLTGDQEFDSAKTLSAFALGLVLFVVTLILNIIALRVVKKYREAYD